MANENGLKYILQHFKTLLEFKSNDIKDNNKKDQDDLHDRLTIDESSLNIPLSKSTIKSLIACIHQNEITYLENKTFVDRFENGTSVLPPSVATTTTANPAATTTTASVKRRKLETKS